ncbi:MAG TPA: heavy metal translocating P-type ATPase [Xanthobacteraceae bacterium]|nr:heavy metal translocating P-type ATPase [Xanthobacteraceae bacterium]
MLRGLRPALVVVPALGLAIGLVLHLGGGKAWAAYAWQAGTAPVLLALLVEIVASLRRGDVGLDIVAALSMATALVLGEALAGVVVALMYAGGQYLESYAEGRASREMTALLARLPRTALRYRGERLEEVELSRVAPGDRLLISRGATVPVDGKVAAGAAVLDESALTGESLPVRRRAEESVLSGSTNAGDAFDLVAARRAAESTYAGIVRLVEAARRSKAPMSRLADRFAMLFLAATVVLAGSAWLLSGNPLRALAVLVIATPCPLILAVPVAIVCGLSRAAQNGVLVKGGAGLEAMARLKSVIIDKTGTLTRGRARLLEIRPERGFAGDEVLRLAASLEQASTHVLARAIVDMAVRRGIVLALPSEISEQAGEGLEGTIQGRRVAVGGRRYVAGRIGGRAPVGWAGAAPGAVMVLVAVDGALAGTLVLADELREGSADLLSALRRRGIARIVLATGDRGDVARAVAAGLPLDEVRFDLTPEQKVDLVLRERSRGPVMMVGDGVNDAPALAAADVGMAMGATGSAAAAEAADAVILSDRLDRLLDALDAAKRSRSIALQSVYAGISASLLGMFMAAFGYLSPVEGAIVQEVIDIAVVLNALRALGPVAQLRQVPQGHPAAGAGQPV